MSDEIKGVSNVALQKRSQRNTTVTKAERRRFLDELAVSCNVRRAADAAGVSYSSFYNIRRREPAFAAAWAATLEEGYVRLEQELLSAAEAELEPGDPGAARGPAPTGALALDLLRMRDARVKKGRDWRVPPPVPIAEVEAELVKILERLAKRVERER